MIEGRRGLCRGFLPSLGHHPAMLLLPVESLSASTPLQSGGSGTGHGCASGYHKVQAAPRGASPAGLLPEAAVTMKDGGQIRVLMCSERKNPLLAEN